MEYTLLIFAWCLWCLLHSALISLTITNYLKEKLGEKYKFYRLAYNLFALATLIPLILYESALRSQPIFRWDGLFLIVRLILLGTAGGLFLAGVLKFDMLHFWGIRQVQSGNSYSALSKSNDIDTSGILSIIRHPWYSATILLVWAGSAELYVSSSLVNVILTVYIFIGTILEERKLIVEYGEKYQEYRKSVSMLFPYKWLCSKFRVL
jgi:protein-S-isoprenylcysteine O-methyltransferase Ste14